MLVGSSSRQHVAITVEWLILSMLSTTTELRPVSLYAETKVAVEQFLLSSPTSSCIEPTVLRFATVYGISPRMRFDLTVNEFTRDLLLNKN